MTRKEARKTVFGLLFESGFKPDEQALDIYNIAAEDREIEDDLYVRQVYFGVHENLLLVDYSVKLRPRLQSNRVCSISEGLQLASCRLIT